MFHRLRANCVLAVCLFLPASVSQQVAPSRATPPPGNSKSTQTVAPSLPIKLVVWTDRQKYALGEALELDAVLRNEGTSTVYVARRMAGFWDGGNLGIEISNEQGDHIPLPFRTHLPPIPPKESDPSLLLPLDDGDSYGTLFKLSVKDFFPKPGKYFIRMTYLNWLPKKFIPREFRGQPVLGAETPAIVSEPLCVEVTP